ncbi:MULTISPECIES: glycerate kinase [unclassified Paenibacillus]|uniref:glycerate kinase family protein n=1 Tax=unclassified Paenibacillus TaxID=185978 RepID=UPI001AE9E00D|nr:MULTISPECIES: glycerate kinase [unclassified Paenibacillus]MBP1154588.1 glycerate kinase [Paenibacillus sp. PvP091]MBP1170028.1 glycerate kinase [Paenibacillus sp. PvR098]MBP2441056.1 glycerate kinase [Paenibacillus sp. PvP052]
MKFVIAPDSFKGSLTAVQVGDTMARALLQEIPSAEVNVIPMADGGEGTVDALVKATGGSVFQVQAAGPRGELVDTYFGVIVDRGEPTAVIEAANVIGLPMVPKEHRNPLHTSTRGLGEIIRSALDQGYRRLIIGLGGSSTNDGGLGLLSALGARFSSKKGRIAEGFGRELGQLVEADLKGLDPRLGECRITIASDVTNPLLGLEGASYIFGPQKGATPELVVQLDKDMKSYADLLEGQLSRSLRELPGAGAAGGLGFALLALGANMVPGAQLVEEMSDLKLRIEDADWVITGEGRSDGQTLFGKLPYHVAQLAAEAGKEAILISGGLGEGSEKLAPFFAGCFSVVRGPSTLDECMEDAENNLFQCTLNVARLLYKASHRMKGGIARS